MSTTRLTTLARPYAQAAFEFALELNKLAEWDEMLTAASYIVTNPTIVRLLSDPNISTKKLLALFVDVLTTLLDDYKENFLHLLAEKKRLGLIPEISTTFKELRELQEKTINAQAITATELDEASLKKLAEALTKKLKNQVIVENVVDSSVIGGAIVRFGDEVIDGSVRGKLNRLLESLSI